MQSEINPANITSSKHSKINLSPLPKCFTDIGRRTLVMGILNVTPDSFSDGGKFINIENALEQAQIMAKYGVDIIDIGGESTRPGAEPVSLEIELDRVIPVIENIKKSVNICISIDTYKAIVAEKAINAGASIVNDISSLSDPDMSKIIADSGVPIILMHKKGTPKDMQINPNYNSVVDEIKHFFEDKIKLATDSGIQSDRIIIDPGIGFGKTVEHNLEIIRRLKEFKDLRKPILIGTSRKSFIGKVLHLDSPSDRIEGTSATVALSIANGADIIRVHDIKEMMRVARMADAIVREAKC
ncbi:TPA: dihydropteroate synthase [bacterium]|nr:dihydropteroate synthase [bacterium]